MARLIVRNIEEELVRNLQQRAAKAGISREEEHRRILRRALLGQSPPRKKPKMSFKEFLLTIPDFNENADSYRRNDEPRKVDLG
jgi:antitoxin FitA